MSAAHQQIKHGGAALYDGRPNQTESTCMSKHRSRRQCKKLHIGEFQELGFLFEAALQSGTDENALLDAFLTQAIDPNGLGFGGWITGGVVEKFGRGSVTEDQRTAALSWLSARPEVKTLSATSLIDMWYSTAAGEQFTAIKSA
ncbi:YggL family protein [Aquabacterium sp.]|uniref:YggL family protein n=1 Tax=Aquabacterium sp. TaxID=1872578 RepID=UPI004037DD9E